ncbi:MAG: helix-turn-helix domain-containing protein, partial [Candidatus Gastranaerophilales bacterium]|nr:helix-turn-helix domain-containing protein [Candidatus Gastranaerophilales bacterium]
ILIGKKIKELRLRKGLTQEDLAEMINTDQRNISYIECGHNFPSRSLMEIAKALNVTLPELFDFEHLKTDSEYKKKYICENINEISDDDLTIIYRVLKAMR